MRVSGCIRPSSIRTASQSGYPLRPSRHFTYPLAGVLVHEQNARLRDDDPIVEKTEGVRPIRWRHMPDRWSIHASYQQKLNRLNPEIITPPLRAFLWISFSGPLGLVTLCETTPESVARVHSYH